jgi:hypothetical protein
LASVVEMKVLAFSVGAPWLYITPEPWEFDSGDSLCQTALALPLKSFSAPSMELKVVWLPDAREFFQLLTVALPEESIVDIETERLTTSFWGCMENCP